jgi:prepilin-type N-terminal cleavage/methylation domain-containing protein
MAESQNLQSEKGLPQPKSGQAGMTMIELLIAMSVLAIGMLGATGMILAGVQSNARTKNDTTAVVLDQEILETFATYKNYPTSGFVVINDCSTGATAAHEASAIGTQAGSGAAVTASGDIDWTAAAPAYATNTVTGYAMKYKTCNGDTYEVRWNITEINANASGLSQLSTLTVSSRQTGSANNHNTMFFAIPTSLHTLIEF